jgi:DNA-binding transcriptional LysR family regulator
MTTTLDLNLIHALDALLQEGSVTRAAARASVTTPAMSRALGRLRDAVGDPLLVRAGRSMVLTPFAISMRGQVHEAFLGASALLRPSAAASVRTMARTLVIRCTDIFAAVLVAPLQAATAEDAPHFRLRFVAEGDEDAAPLRDGRIDLDLGVNNMPEPDIRTSPLFRDRMVAVMRRDHPLASGRLTAKRLVAFPHISVSRRGRAEGPLDHELVKFGLSRKVPVVVPEFLAALFALCSSDLVTIAPDLVVRHMSTRFPIVPRPLPVTVPELAFSQAWHPRVDADPAHKWLRERVQRTIAKVLGTVLVSGRQSESGLDRAT